MALPSYEAYNSPVFIPDNIDDDIEPPPYSEARRYYSPNSNHSSTKFNNQGPPSYTPEFGRMPTRVASRFSANSFSGRKVDDVSVHSLYSGEFGPNIDFHNELDSHAHQYPMRRNGSELSHGSANSFRHFDHGTADLNTRSRSRDRFRNHRDSLPDKYRENPEIDLGDDTFGHFDNNSIHFPRSRSRDSSVKFGTHRDSLPRRHRDTQSFDGFDNYSLNSVTHRDSLPRRHRDTQSFDGFDNHSINSEIHRDNLPRRHRDNQSFDKFDNHSINSEAMSLNSGLGTRSRSFSQTRSMTHEDHVPLQRTRSGQGYTHRRHDHQHQRNSRRSRSFHGHRSHAPLQPALRRGKSLHHGSRKSVRFASGHEAHNFSPEDGYEAVSVIEQNNLKPSFYRTSSMPSLRRY